MDWFVSSEDQSLQRKNEMKLGVKGLNLLEHIDLLASEKQKAHVEICYKSIKVLISLKEFKRNSFKICTTSVSATLAVFGFGFLN